MHLLILMLRCRAFYLTAYSDLLPKIATYGAICALCAVLPSCKVLTGTTTLTSAKNISQHTHQSLVEYCPTPYSKAAQLNIDYSKPFLQYSLFVSDDGGRKIVKIVADELRIDRATLGNLVKVSSLADPTISTILIHARKIRFVESLSFQDAKIEFHAREIVFEDGATLSLLPKVGSKISMFAYNIELSESGFHHFDVRARKRADDFSDIPKILEVRTARLFAGSKEVTAAAAATTLARRFSRFPLTDFAEKIDAVVGPQGDADWKRIEKDRAEWPAYTVAVFRAAFLLAPFDDAVKASLKPVLESIEPIISDIAPGKLSFDVQAILSSIRAGVDLSGNGPAFSTNRPLSSFLKEIDKYSAVGKPGLDRIDFYQSVLKSVMLETPLDANKLKSEVGSLMEQARKDMVAYQKTNNDLIEINSSITSLQKLIGSVQEQYAEREQRLKDHEEQLKKGAQDRAQIISALSTAASIVTTAYTGDPNTGAAVGGVIYAVGQAGEGRKVFDSLSAGAQFAVAIQGQLEGLSKAVADYKSKRSTYGQFIESFKIDDITIKQQIEIPIEKPAPGQPATRTMKRDEALKELGDHATKLKAGIDGLMKVYTDFKPSQSQISSTLEEDESLKDIAKRLSALLGQLKEMTLKLEAIGRIAHEQAVKVVDNTERLSRLKTAPVNNEAKRKLFGTFAIDGLRTELVKFSAELDQLRRLSVLEFREALPIDPQQIQNLLVMERVGEGFGPTDTMNKSDIAEQYLKLLDDRKIQVQLLASAAGRASTDQFRTYVENQGRAPYISYPTEDFTDSSESSLEEKMFIGQLNDLLRAQFHVRKDPKQLRVLQERQIVVPFDLRSKIDDRYPARLLQMVISGFRGTEALSGGDIVFRLEVDRVGNLRKSVSAENLKDKLQTVETGDPRIDCFSVDLRPKTTPLESYFIPSEFTVDQVKTGKSLVRTEAQSFWYLTSEDSSPGIRTMMVTYPPAETRVYIKLRLDPKISLVSPPVLNSISVTAEVFQ